MGDCTDILFIESTPVRVCKDGRIKRNKVLIDMAEPGKSSMDFFFRFKLHLIINDRGEILNFVITPRNMDDRDPFKNQKFVSKLVGKIFGDESYISTELTQLLCIDGIQLITNIKKNVLFIKIVY